MKRMTMKGSRRPASKAFLDALQRTRRVTIPYTTPLAPLVHIARPGSGKDAAHRLFCGGVLNGESRLTTYEARTSLHEDEICARCIHNYESGIRHEAKAKLTEAQRSQLVRIHSLTIQVGLAMRGWWAICKDGRSNVEFRVDNCKTRAGALKTAFHRFIVSLEEK